METFGNDIEIQQGEYFNMDVVLSASNQEYIPFLVSSDRANPYFVITVASTKYEKNMRYVKSWWDDPLNPTNIIENGKTIVQKLETFIQTVPFSLGELSSNPTEQSIQTANPSESIDTRYFYQYTLSSDSFDTRIGHKPYRYAFLDYSSGTTTLKLVNPDIETGEDKNNNYTCKIVQNFSSDITRLWGAQNYMYQITLVSGKTNKEVILQTYDKYGITHPDFPIPRKEDGTLYGADEKWGADEDEWIEAAYKYIKRQWPTLLQPDIDADSKLYYIEEPETIVPPSKLTVNNNLRQMI